MSDLHFLIKASIVYAQAFKGKKCEINFFQILKFPGLLS